MVSLPIDLNYLTKLNRRVKNDGLKFSSHELLYLQDLYKLANKGLKKPSKISITGSAIRN